jgi:hypothetical protein
MDDPAGFPSDLGAWTLISTPLDAAKKTQGLQLLQQR